MKTLAELKAENATENDQQAPTETPTDEVEIETEAVEEEIAEESVESEATDTDEEAKETETEAWMQAEDQTSDDSEESQVPLAAHVKMRGKLKAKVNEQNEELERLKSEIESLKSVQTAPKPEASLMPQLADYEYDEGRFQQAMQAWIGQQVQSQVTSVTQASSQQVTQQQQAQKLQESVNGHYQRAAKLAKESGIEPEVYQASDLAVRQTIESVLPEMGDIVADQLISRLGDGSEKVMYYLGRNTTAQEKLKANLITDPSGISAALYLGELKSSVANPQKRVSRAPKPAAQIQGDEAGTMTGAAKKLREKYNRAHKGGNIQLAYNAKKEAKASGVDVSNW